MSFESRRAFVSNACKLAVGAVAVGSLPAYAMESHQHHGTGDGIAVDAKSGNRCATCEYWGGMRKLSVDNKQVLAQSLGWCNNPGSPNHGKLTSPDHEMKMPGIWKRWAVLA